MYEIIFTIGCFDKLHKGHIKILNSMKDMCDKLIIGIHDNNSIQKIKNITDIDPLEDRIINIKKYAYDVFIINDTDPTLYIKEYINNRYSNIKPITIGSSDKNTKIKHYEDDNTDLYFIHDYCDKFKYSIKDNLISVTRTDNDKGWGQHLIAYKKNWCFMRADDNKNFPSIDYVKTIMPIKYLPYTIEVSSTDLRDYKNNKIGLMNYILKNVVDILNEYSISYYLDCGTLLGCIREGNFMKNDTDVDVTIHLSSWEKLDAIDFSKYGFIRTRTLKGFPYKEDGNMISVRPKFSNMYCDIYANPAFPNLESYILNGKTYHIPSNSKLYLTKLYGEWRIPKKKHANTRYHRGKGLVNSDYSKHWNTAYDIYECIM